MDIELLKTFLEVSKTRHFGRAAEALYLTQSAVSFRIRQLESQLGVSLFTRHRNNIRLTTAGERLLPYAENLLSTWKLAKKQVALPLDHQEFSIGASTAIWEAYLRPWLKELYHANSDLHIEARVASRDFLVKQIHERKLDLLITSEASKMDELISQQIGQISLALFRDAEMEEQSCYRYIKVDWDTDFQYDNGFNSLNDERPVLTTNSAHIARDMLSTTRSCTYLPESWQNNYPNLVKIDAPRVIRPLYAVCLYNRDQLNNLKELLQINVPYR